MIEGLFTLSNKLKNIKKGNDNTVVIVDILDNITETITNETYMKLLEIFNIHIDDLTSVYCWAEDVTKEFEDALIGIKDSSFSLRVVTVVKNDDFMIAARLMGYQEMTYNFIVDYRVYYEFDYVNKILTLYTNADCIIFAKASFISISTESFSILKSMKNIYPYKILFQSQE